MLCLNRFKLTPKKLRLLGTVCTVFVFSTYSRCFLDTTKSKKYIFSQIDFLNIKQNALKNAKLNLLYTLIVWTTFVLQRKTFFKSRLKKTAFLNLSVFCLLP